MPSNVTDLLDYVTIYIEGEGYRNVSISESDVRASYPDNTFFVDIAPFVNGKTINSVAFVFNNLTEHTVDIILEDRGLSVKRPSALTRYFISGQTITIKQEQHMHSKYYTIGLQRQLLGNEDLGCTVYPNSNHESFSRCDDRYMRKVMEADGLGHYRPVWASHIDKATNLTSINWDAAGDKETKAFLFLSGRIASKCGMPCFTTFVESKFEYEKQETQGKKNTILLTFIPWVKITKTYYKTLDIFNLFSEAGGSLGLWLGYCVLNLCQFCLKVFQKSQFSKIF